MVLWWGLFVEDKQEEDISWLFQWGAAILYTVVICMAFAGMVVTRPTVGAAFLEFTEKYGSLLAGIPVLIAVLVAKQQLDANRRQHVATVKYKLRHELHAINNIQSFINDINAALAHDDITKFSQEDYTNIIVTPPNNSEIENSKALFNNNTWVYYKLCALRVQEAINFCTGEESVAAEEILFWLHKNVHSLQSALTQEQSRLSQYWS